MTDYAKMMMEDGGAPPDGLGEDFWMAPHLPYALRQRIETMFEVLAHLPLKQAVAVVADAGKTIALNAPLFELLGARARSSWGASGPASCPAGQTVRAASAARGSRCSKSTSSGPPADSSGCACP